LALVDVKLESTVVVELLDVEVEVLDVVVVKIVGAVDS